MKQKREKLSKTLSVYVTPTELARLKAQFQDTTYHVFADFVRARLAQETVIKKYRNQSLDDILVKLAGIKNDLELIRCNFTAAIDRFYSLPAGPLQKEGLELLLAAAFEVQQGVDSARIAIVKLYEQCSQEQQPSLK